MSKHQEHIVCIKSSLVSDRQDGFVEYELKASDLMLGQRAVLEFDTDFRQVLPISVFTHQGKVWAYERTSKGGESRLHNKVAVAVGGHWDLEDLVIEEGCINLDLSLQQAVARELREEVSVSSNIIASRQLSQKICADDTEVDKVHLGIVWVHELDGEGISSAEDQLKEIGFVTPEALLSDDYNSEGWAKIICSCLLEEA
jgi:predicted NUDIX family phosphoesterase